MTEPDWEGIAHGTFHHVSRKYLPLYLAEFDHRFSLREEGDSAVMSEGVKMIEGKRLKI